MREYEAMMVLSPDVGDEGVNSAVERIGRVVDEDGGEVLLAGQLANLKGEVAEVPEGEGWKARKLAYQIGGQTEGYFVVARFSANADVPQELERAWKLDESVLRFLILRVDELPSEE